MKIQPSSILRTSLLMLALISLAGCSVLESFIPVEQQIPYETAVAQTIAAFPTFAVPPADTAVPLSAAPTYTPQPTYTEPPTYTPLPTYTLLPTYTPLPTLTAEPVYYQPPLYQPTPYQISDHPYTLRVRNQNLKATLWIGTYMPYGGNFIKPLYYVEFYPPQPTWFRICWCRRSSYYNGWYNHYWDDWYDQWNKKDVYTCLTKDVFVDEAFMEIGVK